MTIDNRWRMFSQQRHTCTHQIYSYLLWVPNKTSFLARNFTANLISQYCDKNEKFIMPLPFISWELPSKRVASETLLLCCAFCGVTIWLCSLFAIEDYIRRENSRKISKHFRYLLWKSISTKIATVYFFLFSVNIVNYYCVILSLIQHDFIVYNRPP